MQAQSSREVPGESEAAAAAAPAPSKPKEAPNKKNQPGEKNKSPTSSRSSKRKIKRFRPSSPSSPLTLPQKIIVFLEDNRIAPGDAETLRSLRRINDQSQNARLKKALNVLFLSTGVALLLSVIGVVVFTSFVNDEDMMLSSIDPVSDDVYDNPGTANRPEEDVPPSHEALQDDGLAPLPANETKTAPDLRAYGVEKRDHDRPEISLLREPEPADQGGEEAETRGRHGTKKDCTLVPMQRGTKLRMLDICSGGGRRARRGRK